MDIEEKLKIAEKALKEIVDKSAFLKEREETLVKSVIVNWGRDSASHMYLLGWNRNSSIADSALKDIK